MASATVFRRPDGWYLHAYSKSTVGLSIGTPPFMKLDANVHADDLGNAVIAALKGSKAVVPHPARNEIGKGFDPMLKLAGVKSWAAFARKATNVDVYADEEWLTIEPWDNAGTKIGFVQIPGKSVRISIHSSAAEIGLALKQAMAMCPER